MSKAGKGEGKVFASPEEVRIAYDAGRSICMPRSYVRIGGKRYDTTVGRILLWEIMPKDNMVACAISWLAREAAGPGYLPRS